MEDTIWTKILWGTIAGTITALAYHIFGTGSALALIAYYIYASR